MVTSRAFRCGTTPLTASAIDEQVVPSLVARAEHEVVDHEMRAAVEQLRQRACAVVGVELVLLLDSGPGQLAPPPCQLVT
jgi:hypothetical protein